MSISDEDYPSNNKISKIELMDRYKKESNKTSTFSFNFFLRTGRPGHLFLKPNYTAFTKTNLGSIPSKLEKTLIKTDLNKPLTTYINSRITKSSNKKNEESAYKEEGDMSKYSTSFSSKGFGVGFVSKVNRFQDNFSGYQPGPADYSPDKYMTLLSSVEKSPFGKSLFKKKTSASLTATNYDYKDKKKYKTPSNKKKGKINIIDDFSNDINPSKKKMASYFFTSKSNRFNDNIFSGRNLNPGPGKYFLNNDCIKIKNPDSLSSEFVLPQKKEINPINFFNLNENDKKKFGYQLRNKMKKGKKNSLYNKSIFNTEENIFNKYEKTNSSLDNNSTIFTSNINNNNRSKIPSMYFNENNSKYNNSLKSEYISIITKNNNSKFYVPENDEIKASINKNIRKKLARFKKRDHFSLSPPRWDEGYFHDNDSHFQVPGPAYYVPQIQNNKKSFNLNNKDFIYTNSLPFKNENYGSSSSVLI